MAITNTPLLGLPYAGADTDETYDVLAGLFVKDGQKLTLPEIVERYTPTIGTVYIKAADWTAADGTADAYDAKITISGVLWAWIYSKARTVFCGSPRVRPFCCTNSLRSCMRSRLIAWSTVSPGVCSGWRRRFSL